MWGGIGVFQIFASGLSRGMKWYFRLLGSFPVWVHIRCFIGTVTCLQACRSSRVHGRAEFLPVPLWVLPCTFLKCDIIWYVYNIYIHVYITNFELLDSTRPIQQVSLKPKMVSLQTLSEYSLSLLNCWRKRQHRLNRWTAKDCRCTSPCASKAWYRISHSPLRAWYSARLHPSIMQAFKGYSLLGHSVWLYYTRRRWHGTLRPI